MHRDQAIGGEMLVLLQDPLERVPAPVQLLHLINEIIQEDYCDCE